MGHRNLSVFLTFLYLLNKYCIPGITNMALAHEIAVDKDFTLQKLRSALGTPHTPVLSKKLLMFFFTFFCSVSVGILDYLQDLEPNAQLLFWIPIWNTKIN